MRTEHTREFKVGERFEWEEAFCQSDRRMQRRHSFQPRPQLALLSALKYFLRGLGKMRIALRNWASAKLAVRFSRLEPVWWKLALAAMAAFLLTQKDIQFSINLKAPVAALPTERASDAVADRRDEFNLVQPVHRRTDADRMATPEELDPERAKDYIERHAKTAITEMEKFGVPASISMGQALLESRAGSHSLARKQHNHFGQSLNGRSYESAWDNWRDHSLLLYHEYPQLFKHGTSYKKWAQGLAKAGYSDDRSYAQHLIDIIERHQLYLLDEMSY